MNDYIKKNKEAYDTIADQFSSTRDYVWNDVKPLASYISPGSTVVDVGCGNGRVYQMCAEIQDVRYIGIDQSEELIAIAQKRFPQAHFFISSMTVLPLPDLSTDVVFCVAAFHHLPDTESRLQSLREIWRILTPDGVAIFLNWNLENDWVQERVASGKYTVDEDDDHIIIPWMDAKRNILSARHYWGFDPEGMRVLGEKVGFGVEKNCYTKQGEDSDKKEGDNLLTIFRKPD